MKVRFAFVLALIALVSAASSAQEPATVINSTVFEFPASPDHDVTIEGHALVTGYKLEIVEVATGTVVRTFELGKPSAVSGNIEVSPNFAELPAGLFTARAYAFGPGGESPKAAATNRMLRLGSPRAPGAGSFR